MTPPFDVADLRENLEFETALRTHMEGNIFPAIHSSFDQSALVAIAEVNAYRPRTAIIMANGNEKTAMEIVIKLKLDGFLDEHCHDEFYAENVEGTGAGKRIDHRPAEYRRKD